MIMVLPCWLLLLYCLIVRADSPAREWPGAVVVIDSLTPFNGVYFDTQARWATRARGDCGLLNTVGRVVLVPSRQQPALKGRLI